MERSKHISWGLSRWHIMNDGIPPLGRQLAVDSSLFKQSQFAALKNILPNQIERSISDDGKLSLKTEMVRVIRDTTGLSEVTVSVNFPRDGLKQSNIPCYMNRFEKRQKKMVVGPKEPISATVTSDFTYSYNGNEEIYEHDFEVLDENPNNAQPIERVVVQRGSVGNRYGCLGYAVFKANSEIQRDFERILNIVKKKAQIRLVFKSDSSYLEVVGSSDKKPVTEEELAALGITVNFQDEHFNTRFSVSVKTEKFEYKLAADIGNDIIRGYSLQSLLCGNPITKDVGAVIVAQKKERDRVSLL